ncbi:hypothetical protein ASPZODRAFT_17578 [Penicilliopsis zonata CBS 506.65]|uniref:Zn(2)-C6 fungal-type domain-containing protein n=1 Tax=Penicilliopsis zonata CBS 506.65 TaxID=1073090 RepID=A0A1L9SDZ1_9EURO|nr:hypothetical protein ASPZODRAFT_17578 [Penicilliopsis zonata CBS 506.65]OJJ45362.1 hypothetical protein ASPZODRAFT_17578 [Penicilliopsis zonata CBS 506.65]
MTDPRPSPGQQKRPRVAEENRKRAVRACDGCRRVKEKCEGGVPCRRCLRYRRQCVFHSVVDPSHGEKSRSSSASLLDRAASLGRNEIAEAERAQYMERILAHYVPNLSFDIDSLRKAAEELQNQHRNSGSDGPSTQLDIDDLEELAIEDEDFTIKALPDNTTQYSGEFSYLNFSMKIRKKIDEWMKTAPEVDFTEAEPFEERWRATQLQSGSAQVSASIACLPPRFVAEFLVQIFFKYAQTNNWYVEEAWLREKLNICYTNPSTLSSNDAGSVCAILMVLAVGTQFAHMESSTPVNRLSSTSSSAGPDNGFSEDEVGLTFYQFASKLLPDIIATASVRSVQACLLIGTYMLPLDTSGLSYTYFGLALKMAIQNGMHRRYHGEGLSARMVEIRNRVFWTAYTIEKRISILHGRPSSLSEMDVDAAMPLDFPDLMPPGQVSNHTNMVSLIILTLKLSEVSSEISSLRQRRKNQYDCLERLTNLRKSLVDWWATLPEETNCRDLNPAGPHFRSNVHLKLDFCLTRIFLGRPFLLGRTATSQVKTSSSSTITSKNRSTLVTDCVEAALEIVDLCRLLRDERGLARASFTEFSSCRAALLVILAQSLTKRTERLRASLEQGMGLIKIMSMGVGSARSAVNMIETLERAIRRLEEWSASQAAQSSAVAESGYDRFKNWEMLWKTGPASPLTLSETQNLHAKRSSSSTNTPIPPVQQPRLTQTIEEPTFADLSNFSPPNPLSQMAHFGLDHFVSNFPQELDEFNAIPCFDSEQGAERWIPFN